MRRRRGGGGGEGVKWGGVLTGEGSSFDSMTI